MEKHRFLFPDDVERGRVPWRPWHFIGQYSVADNPCRPGCTPAGLETHDPSTKRFIARQVRAVVEATKAINRMMGKHELTGLDLGAHDDEA